MTNANAAGEKPAPIGVPDLEDVEVGALVGRVGECFEKHMRFVTATCLDRGDRFELLYHFDKDLEMSHLRLSVPKDAEVPSISGVYFAAFLVENEIKELFGVNITGIAVDYKGHLFLSDDSEPTPMAKAPKPSAS